MAIEFIIDTYTHTSKYKIILFLCKGFLLLICTVLVVAWHWLQSCRAQITVTDLGQHTLLYDYHTAITQTPTFFPFSLSVFLLSFSLRFTDVGLCICFWAYTEMTWSPHHESNEGYALIHWCWPLFAFLFVSQHTQKWLGILTNSQMRVYAKAEPP